MKAGGHDVPECKIRERYQRLWSLGATAITHCDSANVYDNPAIWVSRVRHFLRSQSSWLGGGVGMAS